MQEIITILHHSNSTAIKNLAHQSVRFTITNVRYLIQCNVSDLFALQKGFIEDIADPKESGRVRVRLINKEFRSGDGGQFIPVPETQYLPWATVLMPADNAGGTGTFASGHNLKRGDIVWASLINGDSKQRLVIGVQNAVSGSSKDNPATEYQALQRYLTQDAAVINLTLHHTPLETNQIRILT